jgi:branched-chain amino acid transport system permease protein
MTALARPGGDFRTSYSRDETLFRTKGSFIGTCCLILAIAIAPNVSSPYITSLLIQIGIMGIGALGLNVLVGYSGQISIAHAAFFAFGGFCSRYLNTKCGIPVFFSIPIAALLTTCVGLIFGAPAARIKGLYLAIASLAAQIILEDFYARATWFSGGSAGAVAEPFSIAGYEFSTDRSYLYVVLAYAIVLTLYAANLMRTRDGRAMIAVRDHYLSAEMMGINVTYYRILPFGIASFYAGIAGALMAHYLMFVSAEAISILFSIEFLAMVVIGGIGTISGAWLGAAFMVLLPQILTMAVNGITLIGGRIDWLVEGLAFAKEAAIGLAIVVFLIFEPHGLAYRWKMLRASWRMYPFSY